MIDILVHIYVLQTNFTLLYIDSIFSRVNRLIGKDVAHVCLVCFSRAKELVLSIVNQRSRSEGIGDMNISGGGGSGMMAHPGFVEIMIPGPKVGLIIGKGGETIKQLQEKSGAKMVVIQEGPSQEQEKPLR